MITFLYKIFIYNDEKGLFQKKTHLKTYLDFNGDSLLVGEIYIDFKLWENTIYPELIKFHKVENER